MLKISAMSLDQLEKMKEEAYHTYEALKAKNLKLDMSRGKPSAQQLDLSLEMLNCLNSETELCSASGVDCRNYGLLDGLPELKELFSQLLDIPAEQFVIYGNSSLNMMYDTVARAMTHGVLDDCEPWCKQGEIKFLCPVPGYDRHFAITEHFGIQMINVPMREDGPDMDMVERLVESDSSIKGIWCVPKYSNPDGVTYSDAVVRRFAALRPAAKDFRIFWDNAYCVHDLFHGGDTLLNIFDACKEQGSEDMVYLFCSTSKVTFPGSGVSAMAASPKNIAYVKKQMFVQTIGHDKMNQLRHVRFLQNKEGVYKLMKEHAAIIAPKFELVAEALEKELVPSGMCQFKKPNGGYFISVDTLPGCAKKVVSLCKEAGVVLTGAGATYPYGVDPEDRNIRIAPTYPPIEELRQAMEVFCASVKLASVEHCILDKTDEKEARSEEKVG